MLLSPKPPTLVGRNTTNNLQMQRWLSTYFGFSRTELYGIFTLFVLMSLLWLSPRVYKLWISDNEQVSEADLQIIRDFEVALLSANQSQHTYARNADSYEPISTIEYFTFDPNGLAVVDWKRLGLSERQINVIKNYESKGGRFRVASDLEKIYSISASDYERLVPYIKIVSSQVKEPQFTKVDESNSPMIRESTNQATAEVPLRPKIFLDLNRVDSLELQQLQGIGPVFASRIVRFRDGLGGFYDKRQLLDVYGFDEARFEGLEDQVYVDSILVSRIDINTADYEQLVSHPFISSKQANAVVRYRKQHGPYLEVADLLKIVTIDEEILRKIAPYLTVSYD